jgi:hypothetical protein
MAAASRLLCPAFLHHPSWFKVRIRFGRGCVKDNAAYAALCYRSQDRDAKAAAVTLEQIVPLLMGLLIGLLLSLIIGSW